MSKTKIKRNYRCKGSNFNKIKNNNKTKMMINQHMKRFNKCSINKRKKTNNAKF